MGGLVIERETTLCELPRGKKECLRVQFVEGHTDKGPVAWHSLRVFWRPEEGQGEWRPAKQGITIRGAELEQVIAALSREPKATAPDYRGSDEIPF